jgi:hypothetical protein
MPEEDPHRTGIIPQMTAGYSGTPLPRKLGIKDESRVTLVDRPAGFALDAPLVPLGPDLDVLVFFVTERVELASRFDELGALLRPAGGLWIAWPKKASGVPTDLTEDVLREVVLPTGWVDNKVCAIDKTWSGLRFVRRLENR